MSATIQAGDRMVKHEEWQELTQQRDELLAGLREAQPIVWQWEHRVFHGKTELADKIAVAIDRATKEGRAE